MNPADGSQPQQRITAEGDDPPGRYGMAIPAKFSNQPGALATWVSGLRRGSRG